MTYIEFYICCVIANIVLCIPALALGNMDGGSENGFKDITIKDIGTAIGFGLIPLFNFISAAIFAFVVVTYPIIGLCMNIGRKDFWNIHPFAKNKKVKKI